MPYFLAPIIGWFASGSLKFAIHFFRYGKVAKEHMGNGGFPSTHTSTVSSIAFLIGLHDGWFTSAFGIAIGVLIIIMIDATGLRIAVGKQATVINQLTRDIKGNKPLRERMGHSLFEVVGGLFVGAAVSLLMFFIWGN